MSAPILTQDMDFLYTNVKNTIDPVTGLNSPVVVGGFLYQAKLVLIGNATSKAILIPQGQLEGTWIHALTGSPTVYITLSSPADILAGLAVWETLSLSGITEIPIAAIAIYVVADGTGETILINSRMIGG